MLTAIDPVLVPEQAPTGVVLMSASAGGAGTTVMDWPMLSIQPSLVPMPPIPVLAERTRISGIELAAGSSR